jgi:hypothetical protein
MNTKTMIAYKPPRAAPQILTNVSSGIHPVIVLTKQYNAPGGPTHLSPADPMIALNEARKATWIDMDDPIIYDIICAKHLVSMNSAINGKYDDLRIGLRRDNRFLGLVSQIRRASVWPWYCIDFKPMAEGWASGTEMITATMLSKVQFIKDPLHNNTFIFTIPE